jgi:peptidoglycan L-alanyl-D-glutamate endopeptidase CwlK
MASRKLTDLDENTRKKCVTFLNECEKAGIHILVYCTYRSNKEQDELYAQGRTKPGKIVTYARGGQSGHNRMTKSGSPAAKAFDCVPMLNGKLVWDNKNPLWGKMGEIAMRVGLKWAGNWKRFREYPHFYTE